MAEMMTEAQMVADGGEHCPVCGSSWVEGSDHEFGSEYAWLDMTCNQCGLHYSLRYTLSGYEVLAISRKEK